MQTTCIVSCNLPQNALEYTVIILHSFYSRIMKVGRLPRWYSGKEFACQCRRGGRFRFNPGPRRFPGVGNGNLCQYSCLENSMDRGAWRVTVQGVTSRTQLSTQAQEQILNFYFFEIVWISNSKTTYYVL